MAGQPKPWHGCPAILAPEDQTVRCSAHCGAAPAGVYHRRAQCSRGLWMNTVQHQLSRCVARDVARHSRTAHRCHCNWSLQGLDCPAILAYLRNSHPTARGPTPSGGVQARIRYQQWNVRLVMPTTVFFSSRFGDSVETLWNAYIFCAS